jgi:hypothetical protein
VIIPESDSCLFIHLCLANLFQVTTAIPLCQYQVKLLSSWIKKSTLEEIWVLRRIRATRNITPSSGKPAAEPF